MNAVPSRKTKQAFEDTHVQEVSEDNDAVEDEDEEQSDVPLQKDDTDSDSPPVPAATVVDVRTPSPETTSWDGDFRIVEHSRVKRALTWAEVEDSA